MRPQLAEAIISETPNLCLLEVGETPEAGLALIHELVRVDPKLPIIVVLASNDPELVLRCLRQGASDLLIPPFTSEQVEGALQKIARQQPSAGAAKSGKVYWSFLLKIKSAYSFIDALARSHDIDADLWRSVVTSRGGVDVLLSPEAMTEGMSELQDASSIIEYARGTYDIVVLDTGGVYGE
jgi:DNA-binding response OmpR family regulator